MSKLNEEVNGTVPSPSVSIPWYIHPLIINMEMSR